MRSEDSGADGAGVNNDLIAIAGFVSSDALPVVTNIIGSEGKAAIAVYNLSGRMFDVAKANHDIGFRVGHSDKLG
jgi:hypothetical protein